MSGASIGDLDEDEIFELLRSKLGPNLKPCTPKQGLERYLDARRPELTEKTLETYASKLGRILDFLEQEEIDDLRDLDGRLINDIATWRRYESCERVSELSNKTMRDEMYRLRSWLSYLEDIEAVKPGLSDSVPVPELSAGDGVRDVDLDPERVRLTLSYLEKYEYATLAHVVWVLGVRTGRRTGCLVALDVDDAHLDTDEPYLEFHHRPDQGTRLKNGTKSAGHVAISKGDAEVVTDYIETTRPDVTDDCDREPLLATRHGRVSKSTIRRYIYQWSRPCVIGAGCPHDRDPDSCSAAQSMDHASKCPSSRSPHALKHGFITEGRRRGIPLDVLSERCDVSEDTIRKHYDETTEEERCRARRRILDRVADESGGGYL
ncbi:tyrosine-type recombinase/integrase [Halorubrum vacuolatum]|uniref:Site-specific recombinase XerD n=1 Tax=Halorubrum vacuolatum TaxID=63740 RepID=A0A238W975_HALVU|nr:site-specific integrase [Halorubrum vacuolatum]SNR43126.1 Site-specific recombinase XerD [Halorubrum vacuolatum]